MIFVLLPGCNIVLMNISFESEFCVLDDTWSQ